MDKLPSFIANQSRCDERANLDKKPLQIIKGNFCEGGVFTNRAAASTVSLNLAAHLRTILHPKESWAQLESIDKSYHSVALMWVGQTPPHRSHIIHYVVGIGCPGNDRSDPLVG